tara:strand:- start:104 stop:430 length:327 start_codon:yes stop_codon:yes gene_type:complete
MSINKLFNDITNGNLIETKENLTSILYEKINKKLDKKKKSMEFLTEPDEEDDEDNDELDDVDKKELKGKHKDRKDKDIDNDGDVDNSDKFLHKKRKAISKNIKKRKNY